MILACIFAVILLVVILGLFWLILTNDGVMWAFLYIGAIAFLLTR